MTNSFLNAFMPTLPWWFLVLAVTALGTWAVTVRTRLWNARRHQAERPAKALRQAKDVLATVISSGTFFGDARNQALSAYESVTDALKKESSD
jgi:hypothetical protein